MGRSFGAAEWNAEAEHYEISDVIGPDEYHDHVDNNYYTNAICRGHLQTAFDLLAWLDLHAQRKATRLHQTLELSAERLAHWQHVIDNLWLLEDAESGLIEQFEGYFQLDDPDLASGEASHSFDARDFGHRGGK